MRKLVIHEFMTLDGVVQAPGGPDEDREGGFAHGGWVVPHFDDAMLATATEWVQSAGALLLGRKTYEIFAASWPLLDDDDPVAAVFNHVPKYVVSRTLTSADWANSSIIRDDVAAEVSRLKQAEGGELQVHGSGDLVQTLLAHDLIDEFRLMTFPVLVGSGKRLFADGTLPRGLKLVDSRALSTGVTIGIYERAGELEVGAYGPELEAEPGVA
jgi:dihydrofolate reductase